MTCSCKRNTHQKGNKRKPDRYVSFIGVECDVKAARLVEQIRSHIDNPDFSQPFWEYFKKKAAGALGPCPDALLLIHSHLNEIRDLFDEMADGAGLEMLDQIEQECC